MPVTVDESPLAAEQLGLRTVGQVLAHVQKANRLVVQLLIDGREPDLGSMNLVRQKALNGHTLYIETAEPRQMAVEVLREVESQLSEADRLRSDASDLLQRNQNVRAMEKLSGCFSTWQHAQESVLKTAQLLRIDLGGIRIEGQTLTDLLGRFTDQLRQIKLSLENRDFVTLSDILSYETTETSAQWRSAIQTMLDTIEAN